MTPLPALQLRSTQLSGDETHHPQPEELSCCELGCLPSQWNHLCVWTARTEPTTCFPPITSLCKSFSNPSVRPAGSLPAMTLPVLPHLSFVELSILILIGTTNDEGVGYAQSARGHDISKGPFFGPGQWLFFTSRLQDAIHEDQGEFFLEREKNERTCISSMSRSKCQLLRAGSNKAKQQCRDLAWKTHSTTCIQRSEKK